MWCIIPNLETAVTPALPRERAFRLFTAGLDSWWPVEFSWSGALSLHGFGIEERLNGSNYEIGPPGLRWDWGRILAGGPSTRLIFSRQIGPDRVPVPTAEQATEVTAAFGSTAAKETQVTVTHSRWERHGTARQARHGTAGEEYRAGFAQAWQLALERLAAAARDV